MDYSKLIDQIPFITIIIDDENKIKYTNQLFLRKFNNKVTSHYKIEDIFSTWELVSKEKASLIYAMNDKEHFIFFKSRLPIQVEPKTNHYLLIGMESDEVAELKDKIVELEKVNRELDAIIETSYDGIYITDNRGVTLKTNSAIERITKIPKEYYIGKTVDALISRGILTNSVTYQVLKQRKTVSMVQVNNYGKEILITGSPIFNEDGKIEKIVTNIRDLSDLNELKAILNKVNEENEKFKKELEQLKKEQLGDERTIVHNEKMKLIFETARRIANVDATVLILGETGVGKDVLAKYIYNQSNRNEQGGKFIKINCGAIPAELLESELFGYESGAFTGANRKGKKGMFELADKGILFLDEIGELPLLLQVKLLRVLQEKEIVRVGGTKSIKVDVRVIAATNRNLKEMVSKGEFREDLYYRLNVIPIHIPPLRQRRDDILPLVQSFITQFNKQYHLNKSFSANLKEFFYRNKWPGNIRELSNLIERMILTSTNDLITIEDLPHEYRTSPLLPLTEDDEFTSLKDAVQYAEYRVLKRAAAKYRNTYEIADALQTSQATIVRKLRKYGLKIEKNEADESIMN